LHDALQFERLGIPATLVMTEPFQGLAARFGANLGAPGYPTVMVPHPVAVKEEEYLEELAQRIVDDVVQRLTT
jgi:hypothetical protein